MRVLCEISRLPSWIWIMFSCCMEAMISISLLICFMSDVSLIRSFRIVLTARCKGKNDFNCFVEKNALSKMNCFCYIAKNWQKHRKPVILESSLGEKTGKQICSPGTIIGSWSVLWLTQGDCNLTIYSASAVPNACDLSAIRGIAMLHLQRLTTICGFTWKHVTAERGEGNLKCQHVAFQCPELTHWAC